MIVCPACRRHHQEPVCPFCRAVRPAGVVAAGLAALALTGCPAEPPPAPVYGAPPAATINTAVAPEVAPEEAPVVPERLPVAPPYGAAPPRSEGGPGSIEPSETGGR